MTKLDDSAGIPLVRRTFIIALILLSSGFIAGGAIELGFRYQESVNSIWLLQTEMANRAAFKIHQFMQGIDKTMRTVTQTQRLAESGLTKDFEFALIKLLKRVQLALPGDLISRSDDEVFLRAKGGVSYFSPVYFVGNSEPYATIATPIERFAGEIVGVLIAEVNLKLVMLMLSLEMATLLPILILVLYSEEKISRISPRSKMHWPVKQVHLPHQQILRDRKCLPRMQLFLHLVGSYWWSDPLQKPTPLYIPHYSVAAFSC
jgi:hypothetical protein